MSAHDKHRQYPPLSGHEQLNASQLAQLGSFSCTCGRTHSSGTKKVIISAGAVNSLPTILSELARSRPFILSGKASFDVAGAQVCGVIEKAGMKYDSFIFSGCPVKPVMENVEQARNGFNPACDVIIGVGSGVINDIGKLLSQYTGRPYIIVATAPSMDGFASGTSSMEVDGLKVSLDSAFAYAVIGDTDILCQAPMHMLISGVGDMLAKYISLVEWKVSHIINGEYYCPTIAAMVSRALQEVLSSSTGLIERNPAAVGKVMHGLVLSGMAMKLAEMSRPASGTEHYFSHIWDMRSLAFPDAKAELHGIQCGIATLYALKIWEYIRSVTPDRDKALAFARSFDTDEWNESLRRFIGPGAEAMIAAEKRDGKYDAARHEKRLQSIISNWEKILGEASGLPSYDEIYGFMESIGAPVSAADFGYSNEQLRQTFLMTKDIRDKYVSARLLWDIGKINEAAEALF